MTENPRPKSPTTKIYGSVCWKKSSLAQRMSKNDWKINCINESKKKSEHNRANNLGEHSNKLNRCLYLWYHCFKTWRKILRNNIAIRLWSVQWSNIDVNVKVSAMYCIKYQLWNKQFFSSRISNRKQKTREKKR